MVVDESRGNHTGSASKGLVLNTALICTDGKQSRGQNLDKIGICPSWSKALVVAKSWVACVP